MVLDTDVWSHLYVPRRKTDLRVGGWRDRLIGRAAVVSAQTRAEILAGVYTSNWGESRRSRVIVQLNGTPTVPVDERVIEQYAQITAACRNAGHGLGDKIHSGDRWVAATAVALGAPLLAADTIYVGAPGVRLMAT